MTLSATDCDIAVVGAGPVGLFATYYAGFRGLRVVTIDAQPEFGGQITALYPNKLIHDVAGLPSVAGADLVAGLAEQARQYSPQFILGAEVSELTGHDGRFRLTLSDGHSLVAGTVLLATGLGGLKPRPLPVGDQWLGRGVSYTVDDPVDYRDKDVVVIGGGDSALDWALLVRPVARSVTVVHRRRSFRAHQASLDRARAEGIEILTETELAGILGSDRIERVLLERAGERTERPADAVIGALGLLTAAPPFPRWGITAAGRQAVVDSHMQTSVPGIFAAGDASTYPGKVALLVTGFGEAATAVNNAAVHLDPGAGLTPGHSTDEELAPPHS